MKNLPRSKSSRGICDWDAKKSFLRAIYDVLNDKALVQTIVEGWMPPRDRGTADRKLVNEINLSYEMFRKWKSTKPLSDRAHRFWEQIKTDHQLPQGIPVLCRSTIVDFVRHFAQSPDAPAAIQVLLDDDRAGLDETTKRELRELMLSYASTTESETAHFSLEGFSGMMFAGPQAGASMGRIQSTQFYLVPESAHAWAELVESAQYRMYLDCLLTLKRLVDSDVWGGLLSEAPYNFAMTLGGGGSPEKDWAVITSLLKHQKQTAALMYMINDISPFMLHESGRALHHRVHKANLIQKLTIRYAWCDFLRLDELLTRPSQAGSAVWLLLGGTIGNVSERDFFRSIRGPSTIGDLLVVGIDTLDSESLQGLTKRMKAQYRSKEVDNLLLAPLGSFVTKRNTGDLSVEVSVVEWRPGDPRNHSDVPKSITTVCFLPACQAYLSETILACSTRYKLSTFIEFAEQFGWEHKYTEKGPEDSRFRHLVFRRVQ